MRAMVMKEAGKPLTLQERQNPKPNEQQVLIKVFACGVCRTDLHIFEGELTPPHVPLILGHQIVGRVEELGDKVRNHKKGDIIGVPWLASSCGSCSFCLSGFENLCDNAKFTGFHLDGGYADYSVADSRFCFTIPPSYSPTQAAPLLCAGFIGVRALSMANNASKIGFYGFGSSAHILMQIVRYRKGEVYVFTRKSNDSSAQFAKKLGATWVGSSDMLPPTPLDAAIIFAPAGELIPQALKAVRKGGIVISAGIHMSDIPSFPYDLLWEERKICSVANLTRADGEQLLELAPRIPIITETNVYPLESANEALLDLKEGKFKGAAVLQISSP